MKKRVKEALVWLGTAVIFLLFDYLTQGMLERYLGHTLYMMLYIVLGGGVTWYLFHK